MWQTQVLYSRYGKNIYLHAGGITNLGLGGLVLPMNQGLTLMLDAPLIPQILAESEGDDITNLPNRYPKEFLKKYGLVHKDGLLFQAPPRSAHIIDGHKQNLAQILIYAVSIDAKDGKPYFDMGVLEDTLINSLEAAENGGLRNLGIPSLMSQALGNFTEEGVLQKTFDVLRGRMDLSSMVRSLEKIYLLTSDTNFAHLMSEAKLNF